MITKIQELLSRLGITANYAGFYHASYAIELSIENIERLALVTKCLYPEVAKYYNTTANCVERNIRTAVIIAWEHNPELLMQLAKRELASRPTAAQFLAIITTYLIQ